MRAGQFDPGVGDSLHELVKIGFAGEGGAGPQQNAQDARLLDPRVLGLFPIGAITDDLHEPRQGAVDLAHRRHFPDRPKP